VKQKLETPARSSVDPVVLCTKNVQYVPLLLLSCSLSILRMLVSTSSQLCRPACGIAYYRRRSQDI